MSSRKRGGRSKRLPEKDIGRAVQEYRDGIDQENNGHLLHRAYFHWLCNYFCRKRVSYDQAEDMAQETLVNVLDSIDRFRFECSFTSYVFTVANNLLRKKNKVRPVHLSLDDPHFQHEEFSELESKDRSQVDKLVEKSNIRQLDHAIRKLPPRQRSCVELHYYQGRSYREIAAILGIAVTSVGANIYFARSNLKKIIKKGISEIRDPGPPSQQGSEESEPGSSIEVVTC